MKREPDSFLENRHRDCCPSFRPLIHFLFRSRSSHQVGVRNMTASPNLPQLKFDDSRWRVSMGVKFLIFEEFIGSRRGFWWWIRAWFRSLGIRARGFFMVTCVGWYYSEGGCLDWGSLVRIDDHHCWWFAERRKKSSREKKRAQRSEFQMGR